MRGENQFPAARDVGSVLRGVLALVVVSVFALAGCGSSSGSGHDSSTHTSAATHGCAPPGSPPKFIAVILQGIGSSNPGSSGAFDPAATSFCASPDSQMPPDNPQPALRSLADGWLNYSLDKNTGLYSKTDQSTVNAGNNLIDKLASAGGYVLPFSYAQGTRMTGTASSPSFTVPSYTSDDVGSTNPTMTGPAVLEDEIKSIHTVFPQVPIVVVGHSNGGLIAEQWWLNYGSHNAQGVVQVFALDSPLNGVAAATICVTGICGGAVGRELGAVYRALWAGQDSYDPIALRVDEKDHLFTAIGDLGDPLYDAADYIASHGLTGGVKNIGLVSQLYWTEPSCAQSGFDLSKPDCTATGQAIVNPCGHPLDDGVGPIFGTPGDLWLHSLVKNCSGTIQAVLNHALGASSPPAPPTPTTSPNPTPTAAQFTCQLARIQEAYNSQAESLSAPASNDLGATGAYITQLLPILDHDIAQLEHLTPPPVQASDFQALLKGLAQSSALIHQELPAAQQNDEAQYNRVVQQLQAVSLGPVSSLLVGSCAGRLKRALGE